MLTRLYEALRGTSVTAPNGNRAYLLKRPRPLTPSIRGPARDVNGGDPGISRVAVRATTRWGSNCTTAGSERQKHRPSRNCAYSLKWPCISPHAERVEWRPRETQALGGPRDVSIVEPQGNRAQRLKRPRSLAPPIRSRVRTVDKVRRGNCVGALKQNRIRMWPPSWLAADVENGPPAESRVAPPAAPCLGRSFTEAGAERQ